MQKMKDKNNTKEISQIYKTIFDNAKDGILIADIETKKFHMSNNMICQMLGYSPEEIKNIGVMNIHPEEALPYIIENFENDSKKETGLGQDIPVKRKDGSIFYVTITSFPIILSGKPYLVGIFRDTTERKLAEEVLRHERDRSQNYLNTVETIIVVLNTEGRITTVNRKGCQLFGCGEDELIGQFWFSTCLPQPDGMENVYPFFLKLIAGEIEAAEYFENPIVTRSGELRQIAWHNALLRDEQGRIIGTLSSGDDITKHKQVEEVLRENEERYRIQFEQTTDALFLADTQTGIILDCNRAATELTGREKSELIGQHQTVLHPAEDRDGEFSKSFKQHIAGESLIESKVITKSGEIRNVLIKANRFDFKGKKVILANFRDITKRKQAEEALKVRERELEFKTKNLEEINTALNVLLKKREKDKKELEEKVLSNIKQLVEPYISKLKQSGLNERQKALAAILESNLKDITSSFAYSLSSRHLNLTPSEVKITNLITQDKTSKEICEILGSSEKAVAFHRQNIRRKLGLQNKKVNLKSYLIAIALN